MKNFIFIVLMFVSVPAYAAELTKAQKDQLQKKAPPVLVELFTAQKCPACPPADALLGVLSKSDSVIGLSCHVDYFGKVKGGAQFNLGKEFCTDKQTKYIEQIKRKSHFTPQMMINGHMSEIGYEADNVSAAIIKGRSDRVKEILIAPHTDGVFNYSIAAQRVSGRANLWMAIYQKPRTFKKRNNKKITYHNVVSHMIPLGEWGGSAINRAVFPLMDEKTAGFAIVAQDIKSGQVIAAGDHKL